jgi:hypothetical protein
VHVIFGHMGLLLALGPALAFSSPMTNLATCTTLPMLHYDPGPDRLPLGQKRSYAVSRALNVDVA